jgi:uncharacterized lipoprotein YmbA
MRPVATALCALLLTACSASQPSNYYVLSALPAPEAPIRASSAEQIAVGIGPVSFPAYLDRPQLVTRVSANRLDLSEFNRWAEPLQDMFSRTLSENLSALMGTDFVYVLPQRHAMELDYRVAVEVLRFDRGPDGRADLLARWSILTGDETKLLAAHKSLLSEQIAEDGGPEGTIVAMSRVVGSLSRDIARELQGFARPEQASGYDLTVIQDSLRSTGYDPGPVDGVLGPKTREAIRLYQGDNGIRITGEPSGRLQNMLTAMP